MKKIIAIIVILIIGFIMSPQIKDWLNIKSENSSEVIGANNQTYQILYQKIDRLGYIKDQNGEKQPNDWKPTKYDKVSADIEVVAPTSGNPRLSQKEYRHLLKLLDINYMYTISIKIEDFSETCGPIPSAKDVKGNKVKLDEEVKKFSKKYKNNKGIKESKETISHYRNIRYRYSKQIQAFLAQEYDEAKYQDIIKRMQASFDKFIKCQKFKDEYNQHLADLSDFKNLAEKFNIRSMNLKKCEVSTFSNDTTLNLFIKWSDGSRNNEVLDFPSINYDNYRYYREYLEGLNLMDGSDFYHKNSKYRIGHIKSCVVINKN